MTKFLTRTIFSQKKRTKKLCSNIINNVLHFIGLRIAQDIAIENYLLDVCGLKNTDR